MPRGWRACNQLTSLSPQPRWAHAETARTSAVFGGCDGLVKDNQVIGKPFPEIPKDKGDGVVRVLVAIPNEGHTHVEAYANRLANFMYLGKFEAASKNPKFEFYFLTLGRIFTPLAREEAARIAEEADGIDCLFMIDDDMICPDDLFERLYIHDVDVIAPLAFTRNFPHKPVIYAITEGWDPVRRQHYSIHHFVDKHPRNQLVECDAVGFGAALIKMSVIKAIPRPRFMSACGTGEDVYFCSLARKYGFKIFMDTSIKLGHLSHPTEVTEEYVDIVNDAVKMEVSKKNGDYRRLSPKDGPMLVLGD